MSPDTPFMNASSLRLSIPEPTSDTLHVIACIFNPLGWESRVKHGMNFIRHMLQSSNVHLTIVETVVVGRPFIFENVPGITHVKTYCTTMAWSKESAINIGIRSLPPSAKFVAWIDADVEFRDPDWALKTVEALRLCPVVQPWSEAIDLGPKGETMTVKNRQVATSFGWVYREIGKVLDWWKDEVAYSYPHSGYAWAATIEFLNDVGLLLDFSGLGAADHQMSLGMVGHIDYACHNLSTPSYKAHVKAWGDRAFRVCQGHVGYVPGRIEHSWHGEKALRKYVERWDILNQHAFDPLTDIHRNRWGILELSNNKPELRRDVEAYFRNRDEDSTTRNL